MLILKTIWVKTNKNNNLKILINNLNILNPNFKKVLNIKPLNLVQVKEKEFKIKLNMFLGIK